MAFRTRWVGGSVTMMVLIGILMTCVPIDFEYLEALGIESLPALHKLENRFTE